MTTVDVPQSVTRKATERALDALGTDAACRVSTYYSIDSNYAGALFLGLQPNEPDRFTATDLFAVSALNVSIPARGARRFLEELNEQRTIVKALRSLPDGPLEQTDDHQLEAMYQTYAIVKHALRRHASNSSNPWVTASKLVARKRPDLFPVRDNVVHAFLNLGKLKTVKQEYAVFRDLLSHPYVVDQLRKLQHGLEKQRVEKGLILENSRLRLLDVALWTRATGVDCSE